MFDKSPSQRTRPIQSLAVSLGIHAAAAVVLLTVHFAADSILTPRRQASTQLIVPVGHVPAKRPTMRTPPKPRAAAQPALPLAPPVIHPAPPILVADVPPKPQPVAPPQPAIQPEVLASAAPPAEKPGLRPPVAVRTGGFASASTAAGQAGKPTMIAAAGFGDAGVAQASSERRAVAAAAGFGDAGVAAAPTSRASVRSGAFGGAVSAAPSAGGARTAAAPAASVAQILEKPRPAYTEEARRLQIEGEVQLEILFGASGQIHILRVVRGLGHGLDENAAQAARTIRYLPARKDGRAVDSTATVHIIFQLAS